MIPYPFHEIPAHDTVRHTDQLPAIVPATAPAGRDICPTRLTPADIVDLAYSPTFLLPVSFDQVITAQKRYSQACQEGYRGYFEFMWDWNEEGDDTIFVERFYSRSEVLATVVEELTNDRSTPLVWRAGFILGWLSALAFTDQESAQAGVHLAEHLVSLEQRKTCPSLQITPRLCGVDGWPLDV